MSYKPVIISFFLMVEYSELDSSLFSNAEKYWLAQAVTGMLAADGSIDLRERPFFSEVLKWMESEEHSNKLLGLLKMQEIPEWPELTISKERAVILLRYLARAMVANRQVSKTEIALFRRAANWVGLSKNEADQILLDSRDYLDSGQPNLAIVTFTEFTVVPVRELTKSECVFSFHRPIIKGALLSIKLAKISRLEEYYSSIYSNCSGVSRDPFDRQRYLISAKFQQIPDKRHGLPQFLEPKSDLVKDDSPKKYGAIETDNKSLSGQNVACFVCGEKRLSFWTLRPNTMKVEANLFGVPLYFEPYPGFKHCDFSKLDVNVCPRCFFSSNRLQDFQQYAEEKPQFNKNAFEKIWKNHCPKIKKTINNLPKNFDSEERTLEQTILSYEIAIETQQVLNKLTDSKEYLWVIALLQLKLSEALMQGGDVAAAEMHLRNVDDLLEPLQNNYEGERSIQLITLLFLIRSYFGNDSGAEVCGNMLYKFHQLQDHTLVHSRMLKEATEIIKYFQDQSGLEQTSLSGFYLPDFKRGLIY